MPALQPQSEIITLEQYEALPEDVRVEIFDGIVYDMAAPQLRTSEKRLRLNGISAILETEQAQPPTKWLTSGGL